MSSQRSRSAMNSITWYCVPAGGACLTACVLLKDQVILSAAIAFVGAVLLLGGFGIAVYFSIVDRDRLHTEDYHLRRKAMEITDSKGHTIELQPVDLTAIANPYPVPKALPARSHEVEKPPQPQTVDDEDEAESTESGVGNGH